MTEDRHAEAGPHHLHDHRHVARLDPAPGKGLGRAEEAIVLEPLLGHRGIGQINFVLEIARLEMRASGQGMTGRQDANQLIFEQGEDAYPPIRHFAPANGEVEGAVDDCIDQREGQATQDFDIELAAVARQFGDEARQPSLAAIGAASDSHHRSIAFAKELEVGFDAIDFTHDRLGRAEDFFTHGREVEAAIDPMEQGHRRAPLGFLDVMAECRLGNSQGFGGPSDRSVPVDGYQHAQDFEVESGGHGFAARIT